MIAFLMSPWLKIGILAAIIAAAIGWHVLDRKRAYDEGRLSERLVWQEQQNKAMAQNAAKMARQQEEFQAIQRRTMEATVEKDRINAEALNALAASVDIDGPVCPPAVSKRLRDAIQTIRDRGQKRTDTGKPTWTVQ